MVETIEARMPSSPKHPLPVGACDCHSHVFGPLDQFPTGKSSYAIPLADPKVHAKFQKQAGFSRIVLIQPAPYGQDTSALESALKLFPGRSRGVAVADSSISDDQLLRLHKAGVRGLRFLEKIDPRTNKPYSGSIGVSELVKLAPRLKKLGWQAHIWTSGDLLSKVYNDLRGVEIPIVFDHMGHFDVEKGLGSLEFKQLLDIMTDERIWMKMSLCRVSSRAPAYDDLRPYHDLIIDKCSDRLVWGSDWPFVAMRDKSPDVGALIDVFQEWVDDADIVQKVFVENPKRLFGF